MWSNTDKCQIGRWSNTRSKMWSNTDKGQIGRCKNTDKGDQIQIKVN